MTTFELYLESPTQYEKIDNVISFVGEDASGQFGILANHARMITCLNFGLAKFSGENSTLEYIALPSGILYFRNNQLHISARHYIRDTDYKLIEKKMDEELRLEEENLQSIKTSLRKLDEEILKRLLELKRWSGHEI